MPSKRPTTPTPKNTSTPTTGLGETLDQIDALVKDLASALGKAFKLKGSPTPDQCEAAYKYGIAERRRRKLARKVGKNEE